jgi:cytochrome P450
MVGIKSWVAHRNREVFGNDANIFRPERWLEDKELLSQHDAYLFSVRASTPKLIDLIVDLD